MESLCHNQATAGTFSFESRFVNLPQSIVSAENGRVEISVDGADWQLLAEVPLSDDWLRFSIDLSPYAGHVVRVRFVLDGSSESSTRRWQVRHLIVNAGSTRPPDHTRR